jgi:hypothetical protein
MNLEEHFSSGSLELTLDPNDGVIRLKASATFDEPVELGAEAARDLAHRLLELVDEIE